MLIWKLSHFCFHSRDISITSRGQDHVFTVISIHGQFCFHSGRCCGFLVRFLICSFCNRFWYLLVILIECRISGLWAYIGHSLGDILSFIVRLFQRNTVFLSCLVFCVQWQNKLWSDAIGLQVIDKVLKDVHHVWWHIVEGDGVITATVRPLKHR